MSFESAKSSLVRQEFHSVEDNNTVITAEIISAYVSNNLVATADLSRLIGEVYAVVQRLAKGETMPEPVEVNLVSAVPIKKSVTQDFIICLEDGKKFKSLKRHLSTAYGLTPDEYRAKWGLPSDYPIVAPNYAAQRSALAKTMGLGQSRQQVVARKAKR
jgi:predicted transcriptional regulator